MVVKNLWAKYTPDEWNYRKRYSRAINRINAGCYGRKLSDVKGITLTTRAGTPNDWKTMKEDIKKLVRCLREKENMQFEYVLSPELSPSKKLLHMHGIYWSDKYLQQRVLSAYWERIHNGSFRVYIEHIKSAKAWEKYVIKHMVKNSKDLYNFGGRLLMSRSWLPKGWREAKSIINSNVMEYVVYYPELERELWVKAEKEFKEYCIRQREYERS